MKAAGYTRGVLLVAGRELGALFDARIALISTIAVTVLANAVFMNGFFVAGVLDMSAWFALMPLLLPPFAAALTMRACAEEKQKRTLEFLLTLPLRPSQAVLGKYLAILVLFALFLLGSAPIVALLLALGAPDLGAIAGGYVAVLGAGCVLAALGLLVSALTRDQITAFVVAAALGLLLMLVGHDRVIAVLDGLLPGLRAGDALAAAFSPLPDLEDGARGVLTLALGVRVVGFSAVFLFLAGRALERGRT